MPKKRNNLIIPHVNKASFEASGAAERFRIEIAIPCTAIRYHMATDRIPRPNDILHLSGQNTYIMVSKAGNAYRRQKGKLRVVQVVGGLATPEEIDHLRSLNQNEQSSQSDRASPFPPPQIHEDQLITV